MSTSPKQDETDADSLVPDGLGEGNELYVDLLNAHSKLEERYKQGADTEQIDAQRRAWLETSAKAGFEWFEPGEFDLRHEPELLRSQWMEYFSVDDRPFLVLRMDNDEARDVEHNMNVIVQGAEWAPLRYKTPTDGQMCLIDLAGAKKLSRFSNNCSVAFDHDGTIGRRMLIDINKCYSSADLRGGLSAMSRGGVLRGWATVTTDQDSAIPLTVVIDGEHEAHFFASETYGRWTDLKQFSFQLPSRFLDGEIHRISIFHAGSNKAITGASSLYILSNERATLLFSAVEVKGDSISMVATQIGDAPLAEQSAYFDHQRIQIVKMMMFSPSWLATAPLRYLVAKLKGIKGAALSPRDVTLDRCIELREQIKKSQSWRISRPLRPLNKLLPHILRWASAGKAFGGALRYQVVDGKGVAVDIEAKSAPITGNDFSTGTGLFSYVFKPSDTSSVVAILNMRGELLAELSLGRLLSLSKLSK